MQTNTPDLSVKTMWQDYLHLIGENEQTTDKAYTFWHFCDSEQSANKLAHLVKAGIKRATASSLWVLEHESQEIPQKGDYSIIVNWHGKAQCIIQTTRVEIIPFNEIDEEFAQTEGEGDKSLEYWRRVHWEFFSRELKSIGKEPSQEMPVVCEKFEVIFQ